MHPVRGFDFNLNAIFPLKTNSGGSPSPYLNAALRVRLKAPMILVRRYYTMRLLLFRDHNSNGKRDKGEEPVPGQMVSLNGELFVSDGEGEIVFKHTEKGAYKADFGQSSSLRGWIPNDGNIQHYELNGNTTILVPYKVSRVLSGKLRVEKDKLSENLFNVSNIKVTVTADKGEVNSTLTDENGEFYFNLPAGNYIISLSESAFGDQFRPLEFSKAADLVNNNSLTLYFDIHQKKRQINIKKK
ncbi:MAG: carboxypeptidase regulatory-like domain-containing protein [Sphingobacteriales bacterium]|nr:MAG: carboxypeptidase regulatory-like domain-containing protein [Sphingobacteriales bacterium]